MRRSILHISQILVWADAHYERTGTWPSKDSGLVWETVDEKWINIDTCLRQGLRGLRRGSSIARLLAKHRGKRNRKQLPKYTEKQILSWADRYRQENGRWPHRSDGPIPSTNGETWTAVDMALSKGRRCMPGGSSLALLLMAQRQAIHLDYRPKLSVRQILRWADEYHQRTGMWPTEESGPIPGAPGDNWLTVSQALRKGKRGLRRSSLVSILARQRGVPPKHERRPPLTIDQILEWADAHHAKTGRWPMTASGMVPGDFKQTWYSINRALVAGERGLPGGMSLTQLLIRERGIRNQFALPPLNESQILRWARSYRRQHGRWPNRESGPIPNSGGETWSGVGKALRKGRRRLKRTSLRELVEAKG